MGLPENLLAGLTVWGLWSALEYSVKPRKWLGWGLAVISVLSPLVKVSGLIVVAGTAVIFFMRRKNSLGVVGSRWRSNRHNSVFTGGFAYNGELLIKVLLHQGNREFAQGPVAFLTRMIIPAFLFC